jgi:hypothetical protein
MRIYFSGAIMGGRENLPVYQHIVARLQAGGHEVPSAHVADPAVLSHESAVSPREVCERDIRWIEQSDAMVAEVSTPSLGVGYEVAHGVQCGLPILCLYRRGAPVSKMIIGNPAPRLRVSTYSDLAEVDAHLDTFLSTVVAGNVHA